MFGFNKSKNATCPLWKSPCKEHGCVWYARIAGQTADGEMHDHYDCAMVMNVRINLEAAQQSRQAGASADKVATEIAKFHHSMVDMNNLAIASQPNPKLIDG